MLDGPHLSSWQAKLELYYTYEQNKAWSQKVKQKIKQIIKIKIILVLFLRNSGNSFYKE